MNRWRNLYKATVKQMNAAHAVQVYTAAPEREREEAKQRYNEAVKYS